MKLRRTDLSITEVNPVRVVSLVSGLQYPPPEIKRENFFSMPTSQDMKQNMETILYTLLNSKIIEEQDKKRALKAEPEQVVTEKPNHFHPTPSTFGKDMRALYDNKEKSDLTFIVEDKKFYVHKLILLGRYPRMKEVVSEYVLFLIGKFIGDKSEISVPDVHPNLFETILWWLYSGEILDSRIYGYSSNRLPYMEAASKLKIVPFIIMLNNIEEKRESKLLCIVVLLTFNSY